MKENEMYNNIKQKYEKEKRQFRFSGFYDRKYYDKLELIDEILLFIQINFKIHYPPNEKITLDLGTLYQLKEYVQILFSYFNVLPPMQKQCLDKNIDDLIKNNVVKKSELTKRIWFMERDIKKAKYYLISKKDLYEILKQRGLE